MTSDPFEVLRRPSSPRRPDHLFAARLRRRLEEELGVTTLIRTGNLNVIHIRVRDANRAAAFFGELFGWETDPHTAGGSTTHYVINTSVLTTLGDDLSAPPVRLSFEVADMPGMARIIERLGGRVESEVTEGWLASATDNQGVPIGLWRTGGGRQGPVPRAQATGEVGHVSIEVADAGKAIGFYAALLGWRFEEPLPGYPHVVGANVALGIRGGADRPSVGLAFRVDDLAAATETIRALGGRAGEVAEAPTGLSAACADDNGNELTLWEPASGYR